MRVKINESNVGSIRLFESAGFKRTAEKANYFGEVELRWKAESWTMKDDKDGWGPVLLRYQDISESNGNKRSRQHHDGGLFS